MKKFKVYGVLILTAFILFVLVLYTPIGMISVLIRQIISVMALLLFITLYFFLLSVLNYFKEPAWKKIAVIILLINQYVPVFLFIMHRISAVSYYVITLCLNIPFFFAFVTIKNRDINRLTQTYAYTILLVSTLYLAVQLSKLNITPYAIPYKAATLVPTVVALFMCYKMIEISSNNIEHPNIEEEQVDLL